MQKTRTISKFSVSKVELARASVEAITETPSLPKVGVGDPVNASGFRPCCPHCQSDQVNKNGFRKGTQRYKCLSCDRRWSVRLGGGWIADSMSVAESSGSPNRLVGRKPKPRQHPPSINPKYKLESQAAMQALGESSPAISSTGVQEDETLRRVNRHIHQMERAKQLALMLGQDVFRQFAAVLETGVRPITAVVQNAVAFELGFPTLETELEDGSRVSKNPSGVLAATSPAFDIESTRILKRKIRKLEQECESYLEVKTRLSSDLDMARTDLTQVKNERAELVGERNELRALARELEQVTKRLKLELHGVTQERDQLSNTLKRDQSVAPHAQITPPSTPKTIAQSPPPASPPGPSSSARIAPPLYTVAEQLEVQRLADSLMATLARMEGHKIPSADIAAITGIAGGWKRATSHLIGLGQIMYEGEFVRMSDTERLRRGLK